MRYGDFDSAPLAASVRHHLKTNEVDAAAALIFSEAKPDVLSCNMLMNHYSVEGDVVKASELLDYMLNRGIPPTEETYLSICNVMAFHGQVTLVEGMLELVQRDRIELNIYFYRALLEACSSSRPPAVGAAERAFQKAVREGVRAHGLRAALSRAVGDRRAQELIRWAQTLPLLQRLVLPLSEAIIVWGPPSMLHHS